MEDPEIKYLFQPRGVAVIGVSHDQNKIGYKVLNNIVSGGYAGRVYPVNPQGGSLLGLRVCKDICEADGEVDMVCTVVPANHVFETVKRCAQKKVKFNLIITSGFSEVGNREEEKKIVTYAREHQMRVMGPNIFGMFSATSSLNATFGPKKIRSGNIAIITQSGALGIAMIGKTAAENIGLSVMASVCNKADLDESDLLEHLLKDEVTKVIMIYIEGLKNGSRFIQVLQDTTRRKPVVVVKAGRSKKGAMAAAESLVEALEWCKFFSNTSLPIGENTVIVTNGGGIGVLATDACEKYGVKLYDDYDVLKGSFSKMMPSFGSAKNPIDLTGQATSSHYDSAFKASLENSLIHSVAALYCETAVFDIENFSPIIEENYRKYKEAKKPIVFCLVGGEKTEASINALRKKDVPIFTDPYDAISCMGALYSYSRYRMEPPAEGAPVSIDVPAIEAVVRKVREDKRQFLLPDESQGVMKAIDIPIPQRMIARNLDEAVLGAERMGYPVVMKIVSKDILHKSDVGGVALDLLNRKEVIEAYEAILYRCRTERPDAKIEGVEISEMVQSGVELIVGARVDASFGPIVMCGLGGIYVEVMKDVSFRALPLDRKEVLDMIHEIKSHPILLGVRGEKRKDLHGLVNAIMKVGAVIQKCRGISDVEINPLVVDEKGVKAVDVRILLSTSG
jgi:acyl-CoA synthetase (NDP forming)